MEDLSLEERVATLERTIKTLTGTQPGAKIMATPSWKKIVGVYKDDPEFEEAERLGKEWRDAQRDPEDCL